MHMSAYDQQIVIDLEFTTTDHEAYSAGLRHEIIEIGAVRLDAAGNTLDTFSTFVRPECADLVSSKVTELTGIRTSDVSDAPCFAEALSAFAAWIGEGCTRIVAWSTNDRDQIKAECAFKGVALPPQLARWLDLQAVYPRIMGVGNFKRHMSLRDAADWYGTGLDADKAHRALYDAQVTAKMMADLMTGDYLKHKRALEEAIPLRKKGQASVLSSSIGAACAGLAELKAALLSGEQRATCFAAA